jgi:Protein of unknown function (DUF3106)
MLSVAAAVFSLALQGPSPVPRHVHSSIVDRRQLAESWDDLSPGQRDRALKNYQRYMDLPPQKRHDIDQRYEKWKKLPPSAQDRLRKKHDEYRRGMGFAEDD